VWAGCVRVRGSVWELGLASGRVGKQLKYSEAGPFSVSGGNLIKASLSLRVGFMGLLHFGGLDVVYFDGRLCARQRFGERGTRLDAYGSEKRNGGFVFY
jgi:hypothetical protein